MKKKKQEKTYLQEASLGLALVDMIPVICFCISILLVAAIFRSPLFLMGGLLCTVAGAGKALWKLVLAVSGKSVLILTKYFRQGMIGGFLLMLLAILLDYQKIIWDAVWKNVMWSPGKYLILLSIFCLSSMGVVASKMDQASVKANWLEQSINCVAQLSFLFAIVLMWYGAGYYRAGEISAKACEGTDRVVTAQWEDAVLFDGEGRDTALVFYPGAKVEFTAYAPMMTKLAENGVDCFLLEMPYHMALFGVNRMEKVMRSHPEYKHWYLAGHSLGGAMGSSFAAGHAEELDGLILLAAFPAKDLKDSDLRILSIYGSEDGVLNMEKLEAGRTMVPDSYEEFCIPGGNHAQFGDYGVQEGDQKAGIAPEEQWEMTAEKILEFAR